MLSTERDENSVGADSAYPFARVCVLWNMGVDTLAMLPQMYVVGLSDGQASAQTRNFVGLLGCARGRSYVLNNGRF